MQPPHENIIDRLTIGDRTGIVFYDEEWEAYGWRTKNFTNGPYDCSENALNALRDELTD